MYSSMFLANQMMTSFKSLFEMNVRVAPNPASGYLSGAKVECGSGRSKGLRRDSFALLKLDGSGVAAQPTAASVD